ncbi:response regulator transcription factor [Chryseolinea sp. H1M3-3]|uniref:response regulator n=1 Tax=Chryseolinea sp. H1M3-3 TaxID=3034144 RepID=UPI0023ECF7BE|nr:response regulator transcription factor [Chryseolinea sp. H1M3-3]
MTNVRVSVYEDNALLRESVTSLLRLKEGVQVVDAYENVLAIEEQIKNDKPDLVLMDIDMPGMNGIEAVKKIRVFNDHVAILMLTVFDDDHHVFDAICAGASGYLLKKHISTRLFDSIDEMMSGGAPMSPSIARMVISSMQQGARDPNPYSLTPREREMLSSLSNGNSYKLIAAEFAISIDTVRTHIKKIYEKLHVHSQTEAVAKALKEKLV